MSEAMLKEVPVEPTEYLVFIKKLQEAKLIKEPIFSELLTELRHKRKELKALMKPHQEGSAEFMMLNIQQASRKLVLVASYGVCGYKKTRFLDEMFFNSVTGLARYIILLTEEMADKHGFHTIYGDTDSIFIVPRAVDVTPFSVALDAPSIAKMLSDEMHVELKRRFDMPEDYYTILLEPKNVYEWLLYTRAKKKYRGDTVWVEGEWLKKVDVVGFESKRSDAFVLLAKTQEDLQTLVAKTEPLKIKHAVIEHLRNTYKQMKTGALDTELILMKTARKTDLSEYEHDDPHVRAAKKLQELGVFRSGDKVRWLVVSHNDEFPINPQKPDELPKVEPSGYDYYMHRIVAMASRLLGDDISLVELTVNPLDKWTVDDGDCRD